MGVPYAADRARLAAGDSAGERGDNAGDDAGDDNATVAQVAALLGENGVGYLPQLLELIDAEEEAAMSGHGRGGARTAEVDGLASAKELDPRDWL